MVKDDVYGPGGRALVMGPYPHLATCVGCRKTVAQPPMPISIPELRRYLNEAASKHVGCAREMVGSPG